MSGSTTVLIVADKYELLADLSGDELRRRNVRVLRASGGEEARILLDRDLPGVLVLDPAVAGSAGLLAQIRTNDHPVAVIGLVGSSERCAKLNASGIDAIAEKTGGLVSLMTVRYSKEGLKRGMWTAGTSLEKIHVSITCNTYWERDV